MDNKIPPYRKLRMGIYTSNLVKCCPCNSNGREHSSRDFRKSLTEAAKLTAQANSEYFFNIVIPLSKPVIYNIAPYAFGKVERLEHGADIHKIQQIYSLQYLLKDTA